MATATTERAPRRWLRRFGWLVAIWIASVGTLFLLASLVRFLMASVGLSL
ncbi:DUF2474 domain-containing protein [Variovorax paradoxus]|nr:DUF2474 domain-containing protein [Variovorax paradoxus]MDQ0586618.1 hypothetical protein [Variovorax paradoxus]